LLTPTILAVVLVLAIEIAIVVKMVMLRVPVPAAEVAGGLLQFGSEIVKLGSKLD
jgi:hypothetical protein